MEIDKQRSVALHSFIKNPLRNLDSFWSSFRAAIKLVNDVAQSCAAPQINMLHSSTLCLCQFLLPGSTQVFLLVKLLEL